MDDKYKSVIVKGLWIGIIIFVLRYLLFKINSFYDLLGAVGEAVSISLIIMGLYCSIIWKYMPFEKTPRLMGKYEGCITYGHNNKILRKKIEVDIKQTLLSISINTKTNEIMSKTVVGNIVVENDEYILYYIYITNPKSMYSDKNPIQRGTCRLMIEDNNVLKGNYWTSRETVGDIEMRKVDVDKRKN